MRQFLIKITLFALVLLVSIYGVFTMANGKSDPFYMRLATPKQSSLILGSSKAAQGILPSILNAEIPKTNFFNFSFTVGQSPYGPAYLEGIKKKLDTTATDGIFIVTVDVYSISATIADPDNVMLFPEKDGFLATTAMIDSHPNLDYLVHHYTEPYYKILANKSPLFLHNDGWLEVTVSEEYLKSEAGLNRSVKAYEDRVKGITISNTRLSYLEKIIKYLKKYGVVYVVRMPVAPPLFEIEESYLPNFEQLMENETSYLEVPYKSFSAQNVNYQYTDGLHLYKKSGAQFSKHLAAWILSIK